MELALSILFCFLLHTFLQERHKKKVSYVVHVTERTEEAETLDFAVHLFDDEPFVKWQEKLERAYSIAEARRGYNNHRMIEANKRIYEESQQAKADKKVVPMNKA